MDIDIRGLPPEEQELILQFGKISRPFSEQHKADKAPLIASAYTALRSLAVAAQIWEVYGVDISYWQQPVDMSILKTKAMFVICRYGYGNDYVDPSAEVYVRDCVDYGIPYDGYWYMKPDKSFYKHADNFNKTRKSLGGKLYPMFDIEETGGLAKTALNGWLEKAHNTYTDLSGVPENKQMIYISPGFAPNIEANDWMKKRKLDVAHWTTAALPTIPSFWANVTNPPTKFTFWQHAVVDSTGYGVGSSKIDLQRYWGTKANFKNEFGIEIAPPPPPPIVVPPKIRITATGGVYLRNIPTIIGNNPLAAAYYGSVWNTTGQYAIDELGRLWYQVAKEPGTVLWLAAWLTLPA